MLYNLLYMVVNNKSLVLKCNVAHAIQYMFYNMKTKDI